MKARLTAGECLHNNFEAYGCKVTQVDDCITISQKKRLAGLRGHDLNPARAAMGNDNAAEGERAGCLSIIGPLLLIGAATSPIIGRMASQLAFRSSSLKVKDLKTLNSAVKRCKSLSAQVAFCGNQSSSPKWAVFADASHATAVDVNSHQGALLFRAFGMPKSAAAHPIGWLTHKIRRVARSALAAESISCADGFDLCVCLNAICRELGASSPTRLVTDSKSLCDLISTTHDPEERRLKLGIAALRQSCDDGELSLASWAPSKLQLADALTKGARESSALFDCALSGGKFRDNYADALSKTSGSDAPSKTLGYWCL